MTTAEPQGKDFHEALMAILKRRGFLQPAYEIYGGVAGFYDYGPLGAALKRNLQDLWRSFYVVQEGMAEIECPTISPEQVFRASGHLEKFADTVIECTECGAGSRADHVLSSEFTRMFREASVVLDKMGGDDAEAVEEDLQLAYANAAASIDRDPSPENVRRILDPDFRNVPELASPFAEIRSHGKDKRGRAFSIEATPIAIEITTRDGVTRIAPRCPACSKPFDIPALRSGTRVSAFNLMFKTQVGPGSGKAGYLRPETAQGMFMDFLWLHRFFRESLPFGAVQLGRAYRNEISPRQALLRLREFSQMEAEVFFDPDAKAWPGPLAWRGVRLRLVPGDGSAAIDKTAGEAVDGKIVANAALGYFLALTAEFLVAAGLRRDLLRFRQHGPKEKAHYSSDTWDAEFWSPRFGWVEIVGIADRTDYDLTQHTKVSGVALRAKRRLAEPREVPFREYVPDFKQFGPRWKAKAQAVADAVKATPVQGDGRAALLVTVDGERVEVPAALFTVREGTRRDEFEEFTPHVVEPSYGVDRIFYAVLESAWHEGEWVTLRLPARVAPVKAGVFPLMAKDGLDAAAQKLDRELRAVGLVTLYDDSGSIGKRYARADEAGVPFCVTIDYASLQDRAATVRERDSGEQVRVPLDRLPAALADLAAGRATFAGLRA
ncbi:MAG TPA: glycine--tRNA ligase [Candidatus Thermoplasmatota archaeon]|nr:glycine--tRNA ligase [Candidatus Thermoplasmatota archaeon]